MESDIIQMKAATRPKSCVRTYTEQFNILILSYKYSDKRLTTLYL